MAYDNYYIADQFAMLAKLMDIHGENSFKSKSYSVAAFNIEKLPDQLSTIEKSKISSLKGIGDSSSKKIIEILETGRLKVLDEIIEKTPPGVAEMLNIKGLGPKKISTVWKEMNIESIGELLYACNENRLTLYKGFGEKTQKNVQEAIEFYTLHQGNFLYAQVEDHTNKITAVLANAFPTELLSETGTFRRQLEIITSLEWITTIGENELTRFFDTLGYKLYEKSDTNISFKGAENFILQFEVANPELYYKRLFQTSCSEDFLNEWDMRYKGLSYDGLKSEDEIFARAGLPCIPPAIREKPAILAKLAAGYSPELIQPNDIRGIIHSHSTWSDGSDSLETMAKVAISQGLEYLVISDHSKSAFYANGLQEERILQQHAEIDALNLKLAPFRIFKSIESDILNDGSLDYPESVLKRFDLVIASVHSNLKMSLDKAMARLLAAISNPYTTILGHLSGRLLLSRPGYPLDYPVIIEACAAYNVVIELNAHPRRLDMDWRWIDLAIDNNVMISIDPDAHTADAFNDCRYGVLAAQKAGVEKKHNLSSYTLAEFKNFLATVVAAKRVNK
ncbi:helix-hairpin-helix domain-containing protein [Flavitalea sp.]|nr:helix-hairpin-helix domain-containing protein [Flavitalea sp.]